MTISMKKGDAPVSLTKADVITLTCIWPAKTDYDLYAIVVYADGTHEYVATFPAGSKRGVPGPAYEYPEKLVTDDGSVKHLGDKQRGDGIAKEVIEVRLNDRIKAVIPVAYSAQSNGKGSFCEYQVTTKIAAGDQSVVVYAGDANDNRWVYTLVPGMIVNKGGTFEVQALELYSEPSSEFRPGVQFVDDTVIPVIDAGPKNAFK